MMSRIEGFAVVLTERISEEDADAVMQSIRQFRYVADVKPVPTTTDSYFAEMRARSELVDKLLTFVEQQIRGKP
jgi:hypothetical protein